MLDHILQWLVYLISLILSVGYSFLHKLLLKMWIGDASHESFMKWPLSSWFVATHTRTHAHTPTHTHTHTHTHLHLRTCTHAHIALTHMHTNDIIIPAKRVLNWQSKFCKMSYQCNLKKLKASLCRLFHYSANMGSSAAISRWCLWYITILSVLSCLWGNMAFSQLSRWSTIKRCMHNSGQLVAVIFYYVLL